MIRPLTLQDEAAWRELWRKYLVFYKAEQPEAVYAANWARLHDPAEPMWGALAVQDGQAVGLVNWVYQRTFWSTSDVCYLQDLYVAEAGRGQGHGRALIDYCTARATEDGAHRVQWMTHETNTTAQALYDKVAQRSGFIQYRKAVVTITG
ncbi:GNAT family N-acetyltransferase [Devosia sp.]|uniref:GNAT family N-acetyltransferase n=1 Tax=Devosia sp. TaxID=1871048 RepID=UPI003265ADAF